MHNEASIPLHSPDPDPKFPSPSAPAPPFSPAVTALAAALLLVCLLFLAWLHLSVPPVNRVASPGRALALVVGRTMELEESLAGAAMWERWLYYMTIETGADAVEQAIIWYDELVALTDDPLAHLQSAVLQGEAGRLQRLENTRDQWRHRPDPFPFFADVIGAAYLEGDVRPEQGIALQARLAEVLPLGWFYDRLAINIAERAGNAAFADTFRSALAARSAPLLRRLRILTAVELAVMGAGLIGCILLMNLIRRTRRSRLTIGAAPIPPPWRGRTGVAVLIRGGSFGMIITLAFLFLDVNNPWLRLTAMPLASLPLLSMASRHLFQPHRWDVCNGLGLRPVTSGWRHLPPALLALLGAGLIGEWLVGVVTEWLNLSSHWIEWFDADLVWGDGLLMTMSLIEFVMYAPLFEEIAFRGLLYGTLRRRFGCGLSAVASAGIFAAAHGYGWVGFTSVFWSGLLWAWMYEKTGSLLPGILAHALNNLLVCMTVIWLLR